MKELKYNKNSEEKGTLCLGFFDCVHIGHMQLINEAKKHDDDIFVFTFINDIDEILSKKNGYIYSYDERKTRLVEENVKGVLFAEFSDTFRNLSKKEFLDGLSNSLNITKIVCGEDYSFGKKAEGKIDYLKEYFNAKNIEVIVVPLIDEDGEKASTTHAKELLKQGEIERLNKLLGKPYRISGIIERGNNIGSKIGFPTANITVKDGQTRIKEGVYGGYGYLNGVKHPAIINAGARPTFDSYTYKIETYLDGKFPHLYGENIVVEFIFKIRDIVKFNSGEDLANQLKTDMNQVERLKK